jgi:hypothetical protein
MLSEKGGAAHRRLKCLGSQGAESSRLSKSYVGFFQASFGKYSAISARVKCSPLLLSFSIHSSGIAEKSVGYPVFWSTDLAMSIDYKSTNSLRGI